jgi:hypothetical protein
MKLTRRSLVRGAAAGAVVVSSNASPATAGGSPDAALFAAETEFEVRLRTYLEAATRSDLMQGTKIGRLNAALAGNPDLDRMRVLEDIMAVVDPEGGIYNGYCAAARACRSVVAAVLDTPARTVAGAVAKLRVIKVALEHEDLRVGEHEDGDWLEAIVGEFERIIRGGAS